MNAEPRDRLHPRSVLASVETSSGPWQGADAIRVVVGNLIAGLLVVVGALRIAAADAVDAQILWVNVALTGLLVAGISNTMWLQRGRRTVSAAIPVALMAFAPNDGGRNNPASAEQTTELVTLSSGTEYHVSSCLLVRGKPVETLSGRSTDVPSCEVCRP